jgi:hypothetical protein
VKPKIRFREKVDENMDKKMGLINLWIEWGILGKVKVLLTMSQCDWGGCFHTGPWLHSENHVASVNGVQWNWKELLLIKALIKKTREKDFPGILSL